MLLLRAGITYNTVFRQLVLFVKKILLEEKGMIKAKKYRVIES